MPQASDNLTTPSPQEISEADTRGLVATYDFARILDDVLTGLVNEPRAQGLAYKWAEDMSQHLNAVMVAIAGEMFLRTDECTLRATILAHHAQHYLSCIDSEAVCAMMRSMVERDRRVTAKAA